MSENVTEDTNQIPLDRDLVSYHHKIFEKT